MPVDPIRMAEIAEPHATVSGKIRALAAAGYARADIARFLGKRYQHIRNVLIDEQFVTKGPATESAGLSGVREAERPFDLAVEGGVIRLPIDADGAIRLPIFVQNALGLRPGGVVIAELKADALVLFSIRESIRRAQAMVRELLPTSESLADSLIEDRRREAVEDEQT